MLPYVLAEAATLLYAFSNGLCFLSDRGDLTIEDWQGTPTGTLADGEHNGLLAVMDFTWTPQLNFPLPKGSTLFLAFASNGMVQLIFDQIS